MKSSRTPIIETSFSLANSETLEKVQLVNYSKYEIVFKNKKQPYHRLIPKWNPLCAMIGCY